MAVHEQVSLRRVMDLAAESQQALDVLAGRAAMLGLRVDHVMEAQEQAPVRREPGELGPVGRRRAEDRQHVRHPGGRVLAEFSDAADGQAWRWGRDAHGLALRPGKLDRNSGGSSNTPTVREWRSYHRALPSTVLSDSNGLREVLMTKIGDLARLRL